MKKDLDFLTVFDVLGRRDLSQEEWRPDNILKQKEFYYAIYHDPEKGDFIYHSVPSGSKKIWMFDTIAKLKISITNGLTRNPHATKYLLDNNIIEVKKAIYTCKDINTLNN